MAKKPIQIKLTLLGQPDEWRSEFELEGNIVRTVTPMSFSQAMIDARQFGDIPVTLLIREDYLPFKGFIPSA